MAAKMMLLQLTTIVSLLLLTVSALAEGFARYELPVTATTPVLDGNLDDPCWKEALAVTSFSPLKGKDIPESEWVETRALLLATKTHLYLGIVCQEPLITQLRKDIVKHDGPVWGDDSIEFYLSSAPREAGRCVQWAVNPIGTIYDHYYPGNGLPPDSSYESGALAKARIGEKEWSMEMAIPLNRLPVENANGPWSFQINRIRQAKPMLMSSLKIRVAGFKEFASFDELDGIGRLGIPFGLKNLSFFSPYSAGKNCLDNYCSFAVDGAQDKLSSVELAVYGQARARLNLTATKPGTVTLPYRFAPDDPGKLLTVKFFSGSNLIQERSSLLEALPGAVIGEPLRNVIYCGRNAAAELQVPVNKVAMPDVKLALVWSASDAAGAVLGSGEAPVVGQIARLPLQWEKLQPGTCVITMKLLENNQEIADIKRVIRLINSPWENE
jgi:hypothetical protein